MGLSQTVPADEEQPKSNFLNRALREVKKIWIPKKVLDSILLITIIATFFLHLTRADVPYLWYVFLFLLVIGYFIDQFKDYFLTKK